MDRIACQRGLVHRRRQVFRAVAGRAGRRPRAGLVRRRRPVRDRRPLLLPDGGRACRSDGCREGEARRQATRVRQTGRFGPRVSRARLDARRGPGVRRRSRAAGELLRLVSSAAVLCGVGSGDAVRLPCAAFASRRRGIAGLRAAHPRLDHRHSEDSETHDGPLLGFLYRPGGVVFGEYPGAYDAEDLFCRRTRPRGDEPPGRRLSPGHDAPASHAAQFDHGHGPVRFRRRGSGHRLRRLAVLARRDRLLGGVFHRVPFSRILPSAAYARLVFPYGHGRHGRRRQDVFHSRCA